MPLRLTRSLYYTQSLSKLVEQETRLAMKRLARDRLLPETRAILEARDDPKYAQAVERAREEMEAATRRSMQAIFSNRK